TGTCTGFNSTYNIVSSPNVASYANPLSTEDMPDFVMKMAYEPGWGHYEVFGILRSFHDTVGSSFHNNITMGGGGGASAQLPLIPQKLYMQGQFMVGQGIGRYGPTQMPDFAIVPNGSLKPLSEYTALFGVTANPTPKWDLFFYASQEKVFREDVNNA